MSAEDTALERDLRAALGPERPDRDAFREAVERKLEKLRAEGEEPARLSRAAGLLPPTLVTASGFAGKNLFGKLLALLSLPATTVGLFAYLLVAGFSSSRRLDASRDDRRRPLKDVLRWWELHRLATILVAAFFLFAGWRGEVDVLLLVLLLSMTAVLLGLRRASARGMASRRVVAQQTGGFLTSIGMWLWVLGDRSPDLASQPLQLDLVYLVTLGSGALCLVLGRKDLTRRELRAGPPRWLFVPLGTILVAALGYLFLYGTPLRTGASAKELAAWAASEFPEPGNSAHWRRLFEVVRVLDRVGVDVPPLEGARASLASLPLRDQSPFVTGDAAALGLLEREDAQALLAAHPARVRVLLEGSGPITSLLQQRVFLHALVETGSLDEEARDRLARRLISSWEEQDSYAVLEDLREIVIGLGILGRSDLIDSLAPAAEQALAEAWLPESDRPEDAGGFVRYFRRGRNYADLMASAVAVELLGRFGPPPSVDLGLLRRYLRREAAREGLVTPLGDFDALPAAALLAFEHDFGEQTRPGPWARLWGWRFLAAAAALCVLCVVATFRAPVRPKTGLRSAG